MTRPAPVTDVDGPPDRKSVLFCPSCDHASPVDGDWVVRERTTGLEYRCPDCDARITERERERGPDRRPNPTVRLWSTWLRTATAWVRSTRRPCA
jgi:DNA-directed RNA polymerase subunit RPC12/RpoP